MIIGFQVILVICSLLIMLLVLLHKGKGGGLSDLFGGGVSSSLGGSSIAERNLDRITYAVMIVWVGSIVALLLLLKNNVDSGRRSGRPRTRIASRQRRRTEYEGRRQRAVRVRECTRGKW